MMKLHYLPLIFLTLCCVRSNDPRANENKYKKAIKSNKKITNIVTADVETDPVNAKITDDSADDPAIWVNFKDRSQSTIIGTNKKAGVSVYNLDGKELFFYPVGRINNIDLRYNFVMGADTIDLVTCSNRTNNSITAFSVNRTTGGLVRLKCTNNRISKKIIKKVYGFCMYKDRVSNKFYSFINSKKGAIAQYEIEYKNRALNFKLVRNFSLQSQVEGMVADDENGYIYIGEETKGIWKMSANPTDNKRIFIEGSKVGSNNIVDDIEGLSIYYTKDNKGYLLASSQGNFSYAVFSREGDNRYIGSFKINDKLIDGVEETDGIDVQNLNLGKKFPNGIFVVQDGFNYDNKVQKSQNFKIVSWDKIANSFKQKLAIDNSYSDWK